MSADLAIGSPRTQQAMASPRVRTDAGPDAEVPYLAPETLPRWRARLEFHWRARLERVTELSLAYHDAEEADAQPGRGLGAAGGNARPLLRQAVVERRALAEIEAALARLTSGCFGRCERCGGAVSAARLTLTPHARYCGDCDR